MNNDPNERSALETAEDGRETERDIATHIFTTSSVMLGLCLTIISVVNGQRSPVHLETTVDDIVAFDALIFLVAIFLSYAALRARNLRRMRRVESMADTVFLLGMTGMGLASVLFVWTLI